MAFFLLLLMPACQNPFAPAIADGDNSLTLISDQKTPEGVLDNFLYAYTFKDSLVYSELFDSSFVFISTNFNTSPPEPITWGRAQELRTAGRMFRFFQTLDLTWDSFTPGDTTETTIGKSINFTLILDGGRSIPPFSGKSIFTFIRRDEKWLIVRWVDETT